MKQAVIVAHPNPDSFNRSVATAFQQGAESAGGVVLVRDLYAMKFDPCLQREELPSEPDFRVSDDVAAERRLLADVDLFVLVYPFWINAPPAILKGYIDRVLGYGFGFGPDGVGVGPQLAGRKLLSITSSGAPRQWVDDTGALNAVRTLFDAHLAKVCGLTLIDHLHFGAIFHGMTTAAVENNLNTVRKIGSSLNLGN